jgi:ParB/RepB/Spo0J family partition protein
LIQESLACKEITLFTASSVLITLNAMTTLPIPLSPTAPETVREIEWQQLDRRYEHLRQRAPQALRRMMLSIHTYGLLTPITVIPVSSTPESAVRRWIVIDGYCRMKAYQALGKDTVTAQIYSLSADAALLASYKTHQARPWEPLEEASLLQELITHHQYSQTQCAHQLGKSEAWVSHRLQLLSDLPEFIAQAIYQGALSCWCANRVLIPFARANSQHAQQFIEYLAAYPQSSRACQAFYEHYCQSKARVRDRMVSQPDLFFKARASCLGASKSGAKPNSPEQKWEQRLARIIQDLNALPALLPLLFYPQQRLDERHDLEQRLVQAATLMESLQHTLQGIPYAHSTDGSNRSTTSPSGIQLA